MTTQSTTNVTVTVITQELRAQRSAQSFIKTGQRAWKAIKATAEEQRVLWLEVGVALMYGKVPENRPQTGKDTSGRPKYQKFSDWAKEMFPGIDIDDEVPAALWFATNFPNGSEKNAIPAHLSYPKRIKEWFDKQQATAALHASLPEDTPEIVTVPETKTFKTQRDAEKFIKVDQRAQYGGEGADTAVRHRAAVAKAHGTTVEALRTEAAQAAPDMAFRFNAPQQLAIDNMRDSFRQTAAAMECDGISKDAIRSIFIHLANSL